MPHGETLDTIDVTESADDGDRDHDAARGDGDSGSSRYGESQSENQRSGYLSAFGKSAISGAVNNTKSAFAKRHNTLTNNALASISQETKPDKPYSKTWQDTLDHIKEVSRPVIEGMSQTTNAPNVAMEKMAQRNFAERALTRQGINAGMNFVSDALNNTVKADKIGTALGLDASGLMAGKLGDVVTSPERDKARENLSLEDKMAYDMHTNRLQDKFDAEYNSRGRQWGRGLVSGLGTAASLATGGAAAPAAALANTVTRLSHTVSSLKDMAKKNNLSEVQQYMDERDARMAKAAMEREDNRGKFGGENSQVNSGILNTMYRRARDRQSFINKIPTLTNYWKNVYVK
ncbi:hypothetical protein HYE54_01050 [Aggregatibacter actinomycetemcomitans]|uniref:hypothetical protein n=1 Tax=Aggregatibacter actinomycetemcomitans TaxID=714 RepID=UPI00197CA647|nr:hypothetical protein [Aggregatibacter actinomycetemcomitans]MBN6067405.1 hypothetical protein [Aggregatibacter actinomycetemcomitans]MBN6086093.1 hypothetical protein [Aggregatibacter actinomycetemcomitans]